MAERSPVDLAYRAGEREVAIETARRHSRLILASFATRFENPN